jgi:hypothetical protein
VVASEGGWVCACVCVWGVCVRRAALRCKTKLLGYRMCGCVCVCVCVCVRVCVFVGGGGRELASYAGSARSGESRLARSSLCYQYTVQAAAIVIM